MDVPDTFTQAFFIEKDSKRFPKSGGWGYALFNYDAASDTFTPDASPDDCGHACHTAVKVKDYIFTRTRSGERHKGNLYSVDNEARSYQQGAAMVDTKLEVVVIPVSDVDRAKRFYGSLGWRLDADFAFDNGFRAVQLPIEIRRRQAASGPAEAILSRRALVAWEREEFLSRLRPEVDSLVATTIPEDPRRLLWG